MSRRIVLSATVLAVLMTACGGSDPGVLPPDATVDDIPAENLLAHWGRTMLEAPVDETWYMNLGLCDAGASTSAVYMAPTWPVEGEWHATCFMYQDHVLMLVPVFTLCVDVGDGPADTACLNESWDLTSSLVTIDDGAVEGLELRQVDTPAFPANLGPDNLLGVEPGVYTAIFRGQVVLVDGLRAGAYRVQLAGDFGNGDWGGSLNLNLNVQR